jgi:hypothetical protein
MQHSWETCNACRIFVGRFEGVNLGDLCLPRWESNVGRSPTKAGREGAGCIYLVHVGVQWRAFVGAAMYLRLPQMAGKLLATEWPLSS